MDTQTTVKSMIAEMLGDLHAPKPNDTRLALELPLASKRILHRKIDSSEVQLTVEAVGHNGIKRVTDVLMRELRRGKIRQRILTVEARFFASSRDKIVADRAVKTVVIEHIE